MGVRLAAWMIDSVILGGFQVGLWMVAFLIGAISFNPVAQKEMEASPMQLPSVSPYEANLPRLAAMLVIYVLLNIIYATVFWARFRGLPGQLILSLQVGSSESGKNLSLGRAFIRAVVAVGIPIASLSTMVFAVMAVFTTVPWSEVMNQSGATASASYEAWSLVTDVALLVAFGFPSLLLLMTWTSRPRQGLHDRLAKSLVVGRGKPAHSYQSYGYGSGYGQAPGAPGFGPGHGPPPGYWPGYVPPPAGAPPTWSLQSPQAQNKTGSVSSSDDQPSVSGEPDAGPEQPAGLGQPGETGAPEGPAPWTPVPPPGAQAPWPGGWQYPGMGQPPADQGNLWIRSADDLDRPRTPHAATVGRRIAAYMFDCVVVYMMFTLIETVIVAVFLPAGITTIDERTYILMGLVGGVWQMSYFTTGWAVSRGTLGQRLMHLEVADVTSGKAISWLDAVVRWAVLQGPFALVTIVPEAARIPMFLGAMTWVFYLLYTTQGNPDTRGLHDRFMNTRVSIDL
jgi:RDD family